MPSALISTYDVPSVVHQPYAPGRNERPIIGSARKKSGYAMPAARRTASVASAASRMETSTTLAGATRRLTRGTLGGDGSLRSGARPESRRVLEALRELGQPRDLLLRRVRRPAEHEAGGGVRAPPAPAPRPAAPPPQSPKPPGRSSPAPPPSRAICSNAMRSATTASFARPSASC